MAQDFLVASKSSSERKFLLVDNLLTTRNKRAVKQARNSKSITTEGNLPKIVRDLPRDFSPYLGRDPS